MPPEQTPSLNVRWNEVTWYSKLGALVLFLGAIPALCFYIGMQYELAQQGLVLPVAAITISKPVQSDGPYALRLISQPKFQGCPYFYKDDQAVYAKGTPSEGGSAFPPVLQVLKGADPASFKVLTSSDGFSEFDCAYSDDSNHVYFGTNILTGADPSTFVGLGIQHIAHDATSVFYENTRVGSLNGATSKILPIQNSSESFYITDGSQIYYFEPEQGLDNSGSFNFFKVGGADAPSFEIVSGINGVDAKDSQHSYYQGRALANR